MPDLQSELSKVITTWEAPEPPEMPSQPVHRFQPTTNTSRAVFEFVRDNPGIRRAVAVDRLTELGHKRASVSSLITQFVRQSQMRSSNGGVYTTTSEYTPLKANSTVKNAKKAAAKKADYAARMDKRKATLAKKRAALTELEDKALLGPVEEPRVVAAPEFNAEEFVNGLTLKQAKAVYGELKKVFD